MNADANQMLGIDVGGTGIKGGIVDVSSGEMLTERYKFATPQPATPANIVETIKKLVDYFEWEGKMGVGLPAVIKSGVIRTAANIDDSCIGVNIENSISEACGQSVHALNDADAAGIAEMQFGSGKNTPGLVLMLTLGTGIGSAIFQDGIPVSNTELGHAILPNGIVAEKHAAGAVFKETDMTLEEWAKRFNECLRYFENLFWPDLIIVGGGISKEFENYKHILDTRAEIKPAQLRNHAGTVGAAFAAHKKFKS